MKQVRFRVLAILFLLLSSTQLLRAQETVAPLLLQIDGDFYRWNGSSPSIKRLTTWKHNSQPVISPDGTQFVYLSEPQVAIDGDNYMEDPQNESEAVYINARLWPDNLWLMNIRTVASIRIANQPDKVAPIEDGAFAGGIARSKPVWSPDGTQIAWIETTIPDDIMDDRPNRLVVYTVATQKANVIVDSVPDRENYTTGTAMPYLLWTEDGIVAMSKVTPTDPYYGIDALLVYAPDGTLLNSIAINTVDDQVNHVWPATMLPVTNNGQRFIAVYYSTHIWKLVDPTTDKIRPLPAPLEMVGAHASPGGLSLLSTTDQYGGMQVQLRDTQNNPVDEPISLGLDPTSFSLGGAAISPDGTAMAYLGYQKNVGPRVTIWRGGETTQVPLPDGIHNLESVVWGPQTWRPSQFSCPGAPTSQLVVGTTARVLRGHAGNKLREAPSLQGRWLRRIPEGEEPLVLAGPVCADDMIWWQVNYNDSIGWTAEGKDGEYFVEPTNGG